MKKLSILLATIAVSSAVAYAQYVPSGQVVLPGGVTVGVGQAGQSQVQGASSANLQGIESLLAGFQRLITMAGPLLIGIALLALFWGLILFIWKGKTDEEAKKQGMQFIWRAILAIFVMVAIWGIVAFLSSTLGIGVGGKVPIPGIPVTPQYY